MTGRGYYLCGCGVNEKLNYSNEKRRDTQGYPVCPEHGVREYGWRTGPLKADAAGRMAPVGTHNAV
jgi:hypothetical protein